MTITVYSNRRQLNHFDFPFSVISNRHLYVYYIYSMEFRTSVKKKIIAVRTLNLSRWGYLKHRGYVSCKAVRRKFDIVFIRRIFGNSFRVEPSRCRRKYLRK